LQCCSASILSPLLFITLTIHLPLLLYHMPPSLSLLLPLPVIISNPPFSLTYY
jgi:hypothetical protein